ncbi:alpha/beta hydrolase [Streptomyces sp. NBC_00083]|uniref:alpha/beta hydrolase n=1 Tax=Streptomyces sp. NBC_00083 TaxID=2975647 RepID=UPI0022571D03|nr:alpha/beta hydrolase [Streptomyces sp. NBC_00083]MCX5386557.1 alpha/beta hydrolase [Streptomyces sp. NBC_00083]
MPTSSLSTVPYITAQDGVPAQLLDVYRPEGAPSPSPAVLLWHGSGPDTRFEVATLARETAGFGVTVFVPDWRPDALDGGRAHLLASLRYVHENAASFGADPGHLVVAGWSMGAGAAIGTALRPDLTGGVLPKVVVGIAGLYGRPARSTGSVPLEDLARDAAPSQNRASAPAAGVPVVLVHGTADAVIESGHSRAFHAALVERGGAVSLHESATDHAGVVMSAYDPALGTCVPATEPGALRAGRDTARLIARAALA